MLGKGPFMAFTKPGPKTLPGNNLTTVAPASFACHISLSVAAAGNHGI